jgi:hypothetical protein
MAVADPTYSFGCLAGSFWHGAQGNATLSLALQEAGGGLAFVVSLLGWSVDDVERKDTRAQLTDVFRYIFTALVLAGGKS